MFPIIHLWNKIEIPTYFLSFFIGCILALLLLRKMNKSVKDDILYSSVYMIIGIGAGAKVMYFFSKLPRIILRFSVFVEFLKTDFIGAINYAFGGLTFFGGLVGAILGLYIYCKRYKLDFVEFVRIFVPVFPLVHGFGRIGCFLAGCCYGKEYHGPMSVIFPYNEFMTELSTVPRFPVQLMEALGNFIIFAILIVLFRKNFDAYKLLGTYLLMYSLLRFFDEFLRGDSDRGLYKYISTSQIICIILIPIAIFLIIRYRNNYSKKECADENI